MKIVAREFPFKTINGNALFCVKIHVVADLILIITGGFNI